jgi:hypothetical protein
MRGEGTRRLARGYSRLEIRCGGFRAKFPGKLIKRPSLSRFVSPLPLSLSVRLCQLNANFRTEFAGTRERSMDAE